MELNEQLRADQALIEDALTQYAEQWPSYGVLKDAMSYSLLSGGKRIRPVLTLAVCRLFGGQSVDALPFACGLEMLHTYSLMMMMFGGVSLLTIKYLGKQTPCWPEMGC